MDWPPMLSLEQITVELAKMSYRPGWSLSAYQDLHQGPTLRIVASVEDGYHPGTYIDLGIDARIPDIVTTVELLHRWTLWRVLEVESHECREYFRVDGELLRNPHAHYDFLVTTPSVSQGRQTLSAATESD